MTHTYNYANNTRHLLTVALIHCTRYNARAPKRTRAFSVHKFTHRFHRISVGYSLVGALLNIDDVIIINTLNHINTPTPFHLALEGVYDLGYTVVLMYQ